MQSVAVRAARALANSPPARCASHSRRPLGDLCEEDDVVLSVCFRAGGARGVREIELFELSASGRHEALQRSPARRDGKLLRPKGRLSRALAAFAIRVAPRPSVEHDGRKCAVEVGRRNHRAELRSQGVAARHRACCAFGGRDAFHSARTRTPSSRSTSGFRRRAPCSSSATSRPSDARPTERSSGAAGDNSRSTSTHRKTCPLGAASGKSPQSGLRS